MVAQTLVLDDHGYFRLAPDGLRSTAYSEGRSDHWNRSDLADYTAEAQYQQTQGYLVAVRTLEEGGITPADVADPMMREVYGDALDHVAARDGDLVDRKGRRLTGSALREARGELLGEGIERSLAKPKDALGGRSPVDVIVEEYESVYPRPEDGD